MIGLTAFPTWLMFYSNVTYGRLRDGRIRGRLW